MTTPRRGSACAPPRQGRVAEGLRPGTATSGSSTFWQRRRVAGTALVAWLPQTTCVYSVSTNLRHRPNRYCPHLDDAYVLPYATPALRILGALFARHVTASSSSATTGRYLYLPVVQLQRARGCKRPVRIPHNSAY